MSHLSALRDILLVVIGLNLLVFLTIAQPGGGTIALVGCIAVAMILVGAFRTAREIIWRP